MPEIQNETKISRSKWSFAAVSHVLRRLARKPIRALEDVAVKSWEIAPSETSIVPPAYYLPNQLERVTRWEFATEHPSVAMEGGGEIVHKATRGFLLKDVWLLDGALYKDDARLWLQPRSDRLPPVRVENEIDRGALYCSALGNRYFGSWLIEDCVTYPLACNEGIPVTTAKPVKRNAAGQPVLTHAQCYEDWLGMQPTRLHNAFFKELVVFDDVGQNRHKHQRFRSMYDRLLSHVKVSPHPGVFILRGGTGDLRLLHNELELAEHLRKHRGFRILDITKADVPTIMQTCAGAQTVAGVEGSQLVHGLLALPPGGSLLTLQLPDRFVQIFKDMTDRDSQHYGFVVAQAEGKGYRVDIEEVERTLDLFPNQP
ncbi:MAG: glycosyltransferase family 61 protein [Gammaproteobacteria bacterium]|nr:glycosyltransferase family 61 protein [Gammaproteobacteria bacterium]MBU1483048.1 glycosyltransferase family 61 protein [Gammaproteobacteria bacterium]